MSLVNGEELYHKEDVGSYSMLVKELGKLRSGVDYDSVEQSVAGSTVTWTLKKGATVVKAYSMAFSSGNPPTDEWVLTGL